MRKLLILFSALAFLGCSNNDDLPCLSCIEGGSGSYTYCLLYSHCSYMSVSDCYGNGGMPFGSSYECESSSAVIPSKGNNIASYKIKRIGEQVWMAENLDYDVPGSVCYDNDGAKCAIYGRLYDWETAMKLPGCNSTSCSSKINANHQGICPDGWHIPSNADWDKLMRYVDGTSGTESPYDSDTAGRYLKATSGWNNGGNGEDTYGFSALPQPGSSGDYGFWWSASESSSLNAYYRFMSYGEYVYYDDDGLNKDFLFSVRCVQDNSGAGASSSSSSVPSSSSSSSSSITYTLTCASVPISGTAGMAITAPAVTCNGTTVSSYDLYWNGAPNWSNPAAGTYSGISVQAGYGNCSGKTAICGGTLAIQAAINYGPSVTYQGYTYETVVIGGQTWFQRNLNYAVAGSKCGNGSSLSDANTTTCDTYGRLYDWETAMKLPGCNSKICSSQIDAKHHQGICPDGWHIPSNADWEKLFRHVDGTNGTESPYRSLTAGRYLKATSGWNNGGNGVDTYGFSALPGGDGRSGGNFNGAGYYGYWWSASESSSNYAYYRYMYYADEGAHYFNYDKSGLFSVRCLQD